MLKLLYAVDTGRTTRLNIERISIDFITAARRVCLLALFDVTRTLQKSYNVVNGDRLIDVEFFWGSVDAGCSREDFTSEKVVDSTREDRPVID